MENGLGWEGGGQDRSRGTTEEPVAVPGRGRRVLDHEVGEFQRNREEVNKFRYK